ncbi:hypothetical protein V2J09_009191 [Rumex salicifolius]
MASIEEMSVSAAINLLSAFAFLIAFAILRLQPINDRVYFPKWYLKGIRGSPTRSRSYMTKYVNLDWRMYIEFLKWMPQALKMPEGELIDHAGLDSVALKVFVPITILSLIVVVPVNWTGKMLGRIPGIEYSDVDKLSISNIAPGSTSLLTYLSSYSKEANLSSICLINNGNRYWAHIVTSYLSTFWTLGILYKEYEIIANMRLRYIAAAERRPDQFTVLVRNVPPDPYESVSQHVEHFFFVNHPEHYLQHQVVYNANKLARLVDKKKGLLNRLTYYQNKYERNSRTRPLTKTGLWGLFGTQMDAIDYYTEAIDKISEIEVGERERVLSDPKAVLPAAFVSFKSRWGAVVCAQTQQSSNPTLWLTDWAPEPRDVYWSNLTIPYVELNIRKLLVSVTCFFLTFFFMIPIAFVQSLANLDDIQESFPFLKFLFKLNVAQSLIQGFLPGLVLKIFLILLPMILMAMSRIEGYTSFSYLERKSATKYHVFILVNVFLGSLVTGTAFEQLHRFLNQSATEYATFFITYVMVDGWAGVAAEVVRLVPLIMFHLKNAVLVKTEQDRDQAMDPGFLDFATYEPRIQLYFLLGLVYAPVTPLLLPFIVVFFAFAYLVFRHQIINVYDRKYESAAAFWPDVHRRIITGLIIAQLLLLGLLSTKDIRVSTPVLLALPVFTVWFHNLCKGRFDSAFKRFPLQEAMARDTLELAVEPQLNLRDYLQEAYVHPVFKNREYESQRELGLDGETPLVATRRSHRSSEISSASPTDNAPVQRKNPLVYKYKTESFAILHHEVGYWKWKDET